MTLENFRYYFSNFAIDFGAGVSYAVDVWVGSWSGSYTKTVFTLDLSKITGGIDLYIGDHVQCNWLFNCGRAGPDNFLMLSALADTTLPVVTPSIGGTLGQNGWYTSDVTLTWTVADEESAFTTTGCEVVSISADQVETFYTCIATSVGGKTVVSVSIGRDTTPPGLTCPVAGPFLLNSGNHTVGPAEVEDLTSGLDSSSSTLIAMMPTESVGPKTIAFNAYDLAGNFASLDCSYDVHYKSNGFLPPVEMDAINLGKAGRTYPIKWQLTDNNDLFFGDLAAVVSIVSTPSSVCSMSETATILEELSSNESTWRYDSVDNQYIYNWRSPGTPGCYELVLTLNSGQIETAYFELK